jgi:hypothetical protein
LKSKWKKSQKIKRSLLKIKMKTKVMMGWKAQRRMRSEVKIKVISKEILRFK